MFWHSLIVSLDTLGSISYIIKVISLNGSRNLGHWLKINVFNFLSVSDLIMVENM